VKLFRNALALCCIERGTVYSRVARRHEVAQRRYAFWPTATCRLPQVGPDQRLWAVRKRLFDGHNHHCRGLLAVDNEAVPEVRIRANPSASIHAVVSFTPGTKKISPMRESSTRFLRPSIRLLPRRLGMSSVRPSSATSTNPGRSPIRRTVEAL